MGIFNFNKNKAVEIRGSEGYSYGNFSISSFFGTGSKVSEEQAMQIPAVASAVELITSSVAQLPIYLYKRNDKGEVMHVEDRRNFLLNKEPNENMNAHNFKKMLAKDYLFYGAAYTKIEKVRNDTTALYNLPMKNVTVTKYIKDGYKFSAEIEYRGSNTGVKISPEELVIILKGTEDGYTSDGVLSLNSNALRVALDEQSYTNGILKNGALPVGVLKSSARLTQQAIDRLRTSWEALYSGASKAGKTIILEEGLEYQPISLKPDELNLTNIKKGSLADIARIFNVPESMINSAANKYASNEQNNIYFLQYCLSPILTSIESAFNKSLLLESEKENGYYFHFDTSELLRTTEKEKIEATVMGMEKGVFSINEARQRLDMPNLDVDYFTWSLGSIFYDPNTGLFSIPNTGVVLDPKNPPTIDKGVEGNNQKQLETKNPASPQSENKDKEEGGKA